MKSLHDPQAIGLFATYLGLGLVFLFAFLRVYIYSTPYDEHDEIEGGNMAPAVALSGAMVGFTIPLAAASYVGGGLVGFAEWALVSCLVQLLFSRLMFIWLPARVHATNTAGALVYAAGSLCVGIINAFAIIP